MTAFLKCRDLAIFQALRGGTANNGMMDCDLYVAITLQ